MAEANLRLLSGLNAAQAEAVQHIEGPLLILAGPGSGKTRVVTHRVIHLMQAGVRPSQILALTFTNKAAEEMRNRIQAMAPGVLVRASTFHRFCARQLREYAPFVGLNENYSIYDTDDSRRILKRVLEPFSDELKHYTPDRLAQAISWAKNQCLLAEQYEPRPGHPLGTVVKKIYPLYQQALLQANAVDFDDLLLHFFTILRDQPEIRAELDERLRFILVDEYQDTNLVQYAIVRALSVDHPNLAATGDPDQSIYGWRGANIQNILGFEKDFPSAKVVRLEQNYRSTKSILLVADALISHNQQRKAKRLFTENPAGELVRLRALPSQRDEAEYIVDHIAHQVRTAGRRYRDFAIFYRTNALSRTLEIALREHGIPFQIVHGVEFYQRAEIKDILAYLRLINNPRDDEAFLRAVNTPPRGVGKGTLDKLRSAALARRAPVPLVIRDAGVLASLPKKAAQGIQQLANQLEAWRALSAGPVAPLLEAVLKQSGYLAMLQEHDQADEEGRADNVMELLTVAKQYDERKPDGGLLGFLEETALVGDTDDWEQEPDFVTMMTLHASKGLEFPVVFIVAVEHGLLPHERSLESEEQLEEERRLFFVGITRAREELHLLYAQFRDFRGQRRFVVPSQFLMELPRGEMDVQTPRMWSDPYDDRYPGTNADDGDSVDELSGEESDGFEPELDGPNVNAAPQQSLAMPGQSKEIEPRKSRTTAPASLAAIGIKTAAQLAADAEHAALLNAEVAQPGSPAKAQPVIKQLEALHASPAVPPSIAARLKPEEIRVGQVVRHAQYGPGKVMDISGGGSKRTATVNFPALGMEKRFVLQHSQLQSMEGD